MSASSPPALESGRELDAYRIVRRVGVGGMGSVYEAEHTALGRRVALKTLNPDLADNPEVSARFVREGQAVAKIHHPNIVGVQHVGVADGITYLVMDYLDGEDLSDRISREGPLPASQTMEFVLPVISAIEAAHEAGVIHRDLKPANIFLERTRRETVPKVLDFGISKVSDKVGDVTRSLALLGSPHYMSPEQARSSKSVDWRTDLYAIGVILYECLTGTRPFHGDTIFELVLAISSEDPVPPSERNPALPPGLDAVVLRAMARRPEDRYPSLRALALDLVPYAPSESQRRWRNEFSAHADDAPPPPPAKDPQALVDTLMSASREVQPSQITPRSNLSARFAVAAALGALLVVGGIALTRSNAPAARATASPPAPVIEPPSTPIPAPQPPPAAPVVEAPAVEAPAVAAPAVAADAGAPSTAPPPATVERVAAEGDRTHRARRRVAAPSPAAPSPAAPHRTESDDEFRVR